MSTLESKNQNLIINFRPKYLEFYENNQELFIKRLEIANEILKDCIACPKECHVDRNHDLGFCRIGVNVKVSSYFAHFGEENCIRGWNGSGTIFFNMCNMRCVFCQNYEISQMEDPNAKELSPESLADVMIDLQNRGVHNINLVSPDHVVPQLIIAIYYAIQKGLKIPIVYNSSSYSSIQSLKLFDDLIDIYMPDFKFWDNDLARRYTKNEDYPEVAKGAIIEMYRQVGDAVFDNSGILKRGLLVRHLVMPGLTKDSMKILEFLSTISKNIIINIMAQYTPEYKVVQRPDIYSEIYNTISIDEYKKIVKYAYDLGFNYILHDF